MEGWFQCTTSLCRFSCQFLTDSYLYSSTIWQRRTIALYFGVFQATPLHLVLAPYCVSNLYESRYNQNIFSNNQSSFWWIQLYLLHDVRLWGFGYLTNVSLIVKLFAWRSHSAFWIIHLRHWLVLVKMSNEIVQRGLTAVKKIQCVDNCPNIDFWIWFRKKINKFP